MNRLLFEKRGDAVYLSHLDLMRVFQRAFKRADILIWHSQELPALAGRLNAVLPAGIRVLSAYESARKVKELTRLQAEVTLEYDGGIPEGAQQALGAFFARESIVITKHSKKGDKEVDIKPLLHSLEMTARNRNELRLVCVLSAQNPGLNPQLLVSAIETYLPERKPDFARICRMEVLDDGNTPFR